MIQIYIFKTIVFFCVSIKRSVISMISSWWWCDAQYTCTIKCILRGSVWTHVCCLVTAQHNTSSTQTPRTPHFVLCRSIVRRASVLMQPPPESIPNICFIHPLVACQWLMAAKTPRIFFSFGIPILLRRSLHRIAFMLYCANDSPDSKDGFKKCSYRLRFASVAHSLTHGELLCQWAHLQSICNKQHNVQHDQRLVKVAQIHTDTVAGHNKTVWQHSFEDKKCGTEHGSRNKPSILNFRGLEMLANAIVFVIHFVILKQVFTYMPSARRKATPPRTKQFANEIAPSCFIKYWANRYFVCSDPITNCAVAATAAAETPHKSYHHKVFALSSYHNLTTTVTNIALIKHTGGFDTVCVCVGSFCCLLKPTTNGR